MRRPRVRRLHDWWRPLVQAEEGEEVLVPGLCCHPRPLVVDEVLFLVDDEGHLSTQRGGMVLQCMGCECRWLLQWVSPLRLDAPPTIRML